ncbi:hypothetical protein ABIA33_001402 [Streptacidiphilus sp. MAP12-16]
MKTVTLSVVLAALRMMRGIRKDQAKAAKAARKGR